MTRDEMVKHATGKINITDFNLDTLLWEYDELDEITTKLLIQFGLDLLVDVKLGLGVEEDELQEGGEEAGDQGQDGD